MFALNWGLLTFAAGKVNVNRPTIAYRNKEVAVLKAFPQTILASIFMLASTVASADELSDLSKQSQNPVADLITVPSQENANFAYGPFSKMQNVLNVQPVVPITLNDSWRIVLRVIMPVMNQPSLLQADDAVAGFGDLNPTLFLVPNNDSDFTWGVGVTNLFPTATNYWLGQGKWCAGPAIVFVYTPGHWVIGSLFENVWSYAGQQSRSGVSELTWQPFINYNFAHGWFLTTSPIITADWKAPSGQKWLVPLGAGFGRTFKIAKQTITTSLQYFDNVDHPRVGPKWSIRFSFAFLFPE